MNFPFSHRPQVRSYNYKPQYYVPEEETPMNVQKFDKEQFGSKLKRSWENKRRLKNNTTGNLRTVVWMVFIVFVLLFLAWKFF